MPSIYIKCDASNVSGSTLTLPLDNYVPRQNIHSIRFVNGWIENVNLNVDKSMLSIGTFSLAFDPDDTYMGRNLLQKPQIPYLPLFKDTQFPKNIIVQFKEGEPIDHYPVLELQYSSKKTDLEKSEMEKNEIVPFWHDNVFWYPRDMNA